MRRPGPADQALDNRMVLPPPGLATPAGGILAVPGIGRLRLLHATRNDRVPGHGHRQEHRHLLWHAVIYTAGHGSCLVDGVEVPTPAPYLVLTGPDQPHSFSRLPGEDSAYSELTFAPERPVAAPDWSGLLSQWTGMPCTVPVHGPITAAGAEALHELAARAVRAVDQPDAAVLLQLVLADLLATVYRLLVAERRQAEVADPLAEARRFIERHAEDPIDLAAVARIAGCSPKHLGRAYANRFGVPPMRYRTQVLMERAGVLLRTSDAPVAAIAGRLGFADWRFFSRCFTRHHGRTPRAWRADGGDR